MIANYRKLNDFLNDLKDKHIKEETTMLYLSSLIELGLIDDSKLQELKNIVKTDDFLNDNITTVYKEEINDNDYYKNIHIPNIIHKGFILSKKRVIFRGKIHSYDEPIYDIDNFSFRPSYFTCNKNLHCPAIMKENGNTCIMSVEPYEINSFKKIINDMKGNVLIIGLGLGYLPYMLSQKEDINSIMIIEKANEIIEIFMENILPQFPNRKKINIVNQDGIKFLKNTNLNQFSYVNVDIWDDTHDMIIPYLESLSVEKDYNNVVFTYWLENKLKTTIQKSIIRVAIGLKLDNYIFDVIAQYIIDKYQIKTIEDLKKLLRLDNMRELLTDFYDNNQDLNDLCKDESVLVKQYKIKL